MKICNVVSIHDNGEFVSIVTKTGTVIHLPRGWEHSIVVQKYGSDESRAMVVNVDLFQCPIKDE